MQIGALQNHSLYFKSSKSVKKPDDILLDYNYDYYHPKLQNAQNNEDELFKLYSNYSYEKMKQVLTLNLNSNKDIKRVNSYSINAIRKLKTTGVQSSNIEMLLDLIELKKLPSYVLSGLSSDNKISKTAEFDLDKLYEAYSNKSDILDTFVKTFDNKKDALNSLNTGEVFKLKDSENISIKSDDNTVKELFITPKTYLELFPPVERFIFNQSFEAGDCYFLAALDSINQNPYTRYKLLEMFKENPDKTIDVCMGGFKKENNTIVQNRNDFILKDVLSKVNSQNQDELSHTCLGLKALEVLNEEERRNRAKTYILEQNDKFMELINYINNGDFIQDKMFLKDISYGFRDEKDIKNIEENYLKENSVFYDRYIYSIDELKSYISFLMSHKTEDIISLKEKNDDLVLYPDEINSKLEELNSKDDFISNYEKLILTRYKNYLDFYGLEYVCPKDECMPKEIYEDIFPDTNKKYSDGGLSYEVFSKMGFSGFDRLNSCSNILKKMFLDKNCIFTARCFESDENNPFLPFHAYSIQPFSDNGELYFIVRNPHNTINEKTISYEELKEYFSDIDYAKLN